jgi:hypothetical protein
MKLTQIAVCSAALLAFAGSATGQGISSINVVGYANVRIGAGNDIYANPFDLDGLNSADKILNHAPVSDAGGQPGLDAFYINTYNGVSFNSVYFEQDFTAANTGGAVTNGWATDGLGSAQGIPPNLPPGKGFFINNGGPIVTNVFTGSVVPAPGTKNCMTIVAGNQLIASVLPINGPLVPVPTNFPPPCPPFPPMYFPIACPGDLGGNPGLDAFYINTYNGNTFDSVYYEQDFTSANTGGAVTNGWATDGLGSHQGFPPTVRIGHGFFLNNSGPIYSWCETNSF